MWLVVASALFWLSWTLMPGVGVTDTRQILERVALQRDAVWLSTALQLISAACFAPAIAGLVRLGDARGRRGLVTGAVLLAVGAMGSAADAIFHLLAYYMTEPGMDLAAMAPLMDRMQGPGLALLAPMLLAFFAGAAVLAVSAARAGVVSRWNPRLQAAALAVAVAAPLLVRTGLPARAIGLTVLGLISASLTGLGWALASAVPPRRVALATVAGLFAVGLATYFAGERTEVVVLRTVDASGATFETKMWVVDHDGVPWVRVANPERGWYRRLVAHPEVVLVRNGDTMARIAHPDDSLATRRAIDQAFAAKYGLTDAWYGALLRRSPVPIRLDPARGGGDVRGFGS
jgi:hypothetical protein